MNQPTFNDSMLDELGQLHKIELGILLDISRVCQQYGLRFYLAEGSLIGAIRHKGFIPWDDDVDIAMPREDYEKFLKVAPAALGERYEVQHSTTIKNYWSPFIKIRLLSDTHLFRQQHIAHLTENNGPLVDIFPLDNVPKLHSFSQTMNRRLIGLYRGAITRKLGCVKNTSFKGRIISLFSHFVTIDWLHRKLERLHTKYNSPQNGYLVNWASYYPANRETFPREAFGEPLMVPFEGYEMPVPCDYDTVLTTIYGDYMTPPPPEKRVIKHNFEI